MTLFAGTAGAQEGEWSGPIRLPEWSVDPDGEFVTVTYGLAQSGSESYEVGLQLTNREQQILTEPEAVTGHIGTVTPGNVRKIIWHYRKDYPAGLQGRGWKFLLIVAWGRQKVTVATREGTFTPPHLVLENATFAGANPGSVLDAGERGILTFILRNDGIGEATGTQVRLTPLQPAEALRLDTLLSVGNMLPGATIPLQTTLHAPQDLPTGVAKIRLRAGDRYGYSVVNDTVSVATRAFRPPALEIADRLLQTSGEKVYRRLADRPMLIRGDTSAIVLEIRNRGRGRADSLRATVMLDGEGWNAHFLGSSRVTALRDLEPDSSEFVVIPILADERAEAEYISLRVAVSERHPACGIADTIRVPARRRFLTFDAQFADLMRRGDFDSAGTLCRRQLLLEPRRAALYALLGAVYESLGDRSRAVEQYAFAAERGDRTAASWLQANATFREVTSVRYEAMPLPFLDGGTTVTVGVFPVPAGDDDPAGDRLYGLLRSNTDRKRVVLVPYKAMTSQLGLASIRSADSVALRKMSRDLGITYVIDVREADRTMQSFSLIVLRTADAQMVFTRKFQQSVVSTALQDAGRLFRESMVPVYSTRKAYSPKPTR